jgi:hypothetical protein
MYAVANTHFLPFDSVPVIWCRLLHGFATVIWETLLLCIGLTLRQHGRRLLITYFTILKIAIALPLFKDRPNVTTMLHFVTGFEFVVRFTWSTSLVQRLGLNGACGISDVPPDTSYYWYHLPSSVARIYLSPIVVLSALQLLFQAVYWLVICVSMHENHQRLMWKSVIRNVSPGFRALSGMNCTTLSTSDSS